MGRMKELFMEMQERELEHMPLNEYLAMIHNERRMEQPHPDPEDDLDDKYWQEKADLQDMYEKDVENEIQKEAELPINKKLSPCLSHKFEKE